MDSADKNLLIRLTDDAASSGETKALDIWDDRYAISPSNTILSSAVGRLKGISVLFLATVAIPTLLATIYFGFIASDVYVSESRFVVRSPERQSASPLGFILQDAGFSRADDDTFAVQDFILSRDALQSLDEDLGIRRAFSSGLIDRFNRFPGPFQDDNFEGFYAYYENQVEMQLDSISSIATLTVRAFTSWDAYAMNLKLLEYAEALINKLNERGRQDMIRFAADEVAGLEEKAKTAALALARYRNEAGVIDPEKQSEIPLQQIAKLQDELIATKGQILQIERVARQNPQLPSLRQHAALLKREIEAETLRVAGKGDQSLASKAAEYQRLALEKEFADTMLASAMSNLEQARNEAQRQQLYLERIVQPNHPDVAVEPRRALIILVVFVLGLIAWGVLRMLSAGIREHQE
uniref:Capsular polysaccharide transport system permease protein n=1 Tax=Candidatus Kentrum sp. DK TaxID=2126562 RepID=A0A450S9M5_9GAMM|nr:MAG: capsular polysaccharide transport system permease protein [Candidatus Kentron sp. DK]